MKIASIPCGLTLVLALGACQGAGKSALGPAADLDPAAMEQRMRELATPGEQHARLMKLAGKWNDSYRFRWSPEAPWSEASGTSIFVPMLDGRYIRMEANFEVMGMPMKGVQILGFDNLTGEYTAHWMDSMSTWSVSSRGRETQEGVCEMRGTMADLAGQRPFRMVIRRTSEDTAEMDMYDTIPPQGEVLVMSIRSTRAD